MFLRFSDSTTALIGRENILILKTHRKTFVKVGEHVDEINPRFSITGGRWFVKLVVASMQSYIAVQQVKGEGIEKQKKTQGANDERCLTAFVSKRVKPQSKRWGQRNAND